MSDFDFWTTAELRAQGHTTESIRSAIEFGSIERIIRGWYGSRSTDREAIRAMRLGGRLGCVSALRMHGAWVPPDVGMHLQFPTSASGRRLSKRGLPDDATAHWHGKDDRTGSRFAVAPISLAAAQMLECQPAHLVVATFDSLLSRRLISRNRLLTIIAQGPRRTHFLAGHLDARSEEGIESIVRFQLAMAGIHCEVQVRIRGHRVDLLIDGWLVIELDGRATHAQEGAFTRDRVRVGSLMRDGRVVLQFGYATIMYDWDFVLTTIRSVLAQHAPIA